MTYKLKIDLLGNKIDIGDIVIHFNTFYHVVSYTTKRLKCMKLRNITPQHLTSDVFINSIKAANIWYGSGRKLELLYAHEVIKVDIENDVEFKLKILGLLDD